MQMGDRNNIQGLAVSYLSHIWEMSAQKSFIFCKQIGMRIVGVPILIVFCILKKYSLFFQCYILENSLMHICQIYITVFLFLF